jgi:hypothetical protein
LAGYSDETAFPARKGGHRRVFDLIPDTDAFDIVVATRTAPGCCIETGWAAGTGDGGAAVPAGTRHLAARDFSNDGTTDLAAGAG